MVTTHHVHESQFESYLEDHNYYSGILNSEAIELVKNDDGFNRVTFDNTLTLEYVKDTNEFVITITRLAPHMQ